MSKVIKNKLAEYGYNLVALPKEGVAPLLLLYKNKKDVSLAGGPVSMLFAIADDPPPVPSLNNKVASLQSNSSVTFDAQAGINILGWLLKKLKMGKLGGEINVDSMRSMEISYENVLEDSVSLLELDNFLSGSDPKVDNFNTFKDRLMDSDLYVVNAVLKSNSFSVSAENKNGQKMDLETTIKGIVDADVNVKRGKNSSVTLNHDEGPPLVFAFKAQQIVYDHKKWWQFFKKDEAGFRIKDEQGIVLKDESGFPTRPLQQDDELVDI